MAGALCRCGCPVLPDNDNSYDAIVVSKLFQHVPDWQAACLELLRVLRLGACIFQVTDRGAFGNAVRKYFAGRADTLGYTERYLGLDSRDIGRLTEFLVAQGCEKITIDVTDLRWEKQVSYGEALSQLHERLFAEFWYLPADVYERILADTSGWIDEQPEGRQPIEPMTPHLRADVFRKPSG